MNLREKGYLLDSISPVAGSSKGHNKPLGSYKGQGISWLAEWLLACQRGSCSVKLVMPTSDWVTTSHSCSYATAWQQVVLCWMQRRRWSHWVSAILWAPLYAPCPLTDLLLEVQSTTPVEFGLHLAASIQVQTSIIWILLRSETFIMYFLFLQIKVKIKKIECTW